MIYRQYGKHFTHAYCTEAVRTLLRVDAPSFYRVEREDPLDAEVLEHETRMQKHWIREVETFKSNKEKVREQERPV